MAVSLAAAAESASPRTVLETYYRALRKAAGHRGWWPGDTRLEIIVGAILTQNTAWRNVEQALRALRRGRGLTARRLREMSEEELSERIRSSGYYRQKARKIKAFLEYLDLQHRGSLTRMAYEPTKRLRSQLLGIWGIGPETADSILLYAFERPAFVVDAYTRRVLDRHRLVAGATNDAKIQDFLVRNLPRSVPLYNDFHAQFVWVGQRHCRSVARCSGCPLERFLPGGPPVAAARSRRTLA